MKYEDNYSREKIGFITKVCDLYYNSDLSQHEISTRLNISRSQVSKILKSAREKGIVTITINTMFSEENKYQHFLIEKFGLRDAVVVDTIGLSTNDSYNKISESFNFLFDKIVKDGDHIGIMAGDSINRISKRLIGISRKELEIYPLVGGFGVTGEDWQANNNVKNFGERLDSKFFQLNCPAYISDESMHALMPTLPDIKFVAERAEKVTIAIISIGQLGPKATLVRSGILSEEDIFELQDKNAIASVCASFLDRDGKLIECNTSKKMFGCTVPALKNANTVIAVAYGNSKIEAICATLKSNCADILVTDLNTAKKIFDHCK